MTVAFQPTVPADLTRPATSGIESRIGMAWAMCSPPMATICRPAGQRSAAGPGDPLRLDGTEILPMMESLDVG